MRITITGPRSVGKSTISKIVADKLKLKWISSDKIGEEAMKEHGGLDKAIKSGLIKKFIKKGAYNLIRDVYKTESFVFDLSGGSVSSKSFPEASEKVRKVARDKSIVIGLLPFQDENKSINLLFKREEKRLHFKEEDSTELLKRVSKDYKKFPHLFKSFCNLIIYTKEKSPLDISKEIILLLKKKV